MMGPHRSLLIGWVLQIGSHFVEWEQYHLKNLNVQFNVQSNGSLMSLSIMQSYIQLVLLNSLRNKLK